MGWQKKHILTSEQISFIKDNYVRLTNRELAAALGQRLTTTRTQLYELGLKRMELEYFTKAQVNFIKSNFKYMGDTEIAENFNSRYHKVKGWHKRHIEKKRRYLGLKRTSDELRAIRIRNKQAGRFSINHYKRWLGKVTPEGAIKIWNMNGYKIPMIRTATGFVKLSHYNWLQHYGPVPKKKMIIHLDGNTENCAIENLSCIGNNQQAGRNFTFENKVNSDNYIAMLLSQSDRKMQEKIISNKPLLEIKRAELKLRRAIKNVE